MFGCRLIQSGTRVRKGSRGVLPGSLRKVIYAASHEARTSFEAVARNGKIMAIVTAWGNVMLILDDDHLCETCSSSTKARGLSPKAT